MDEPLLSSLRHTHPSLSPALLDELEVLSSIYSIDSPSLSLAPTAPPSAFQLELILDTSIPGEGDAEEAEGGLKVLISLPPHYPASLTPPSLSLVNLYLGPYSIPPRLTARIAKVYGGEEGVEWTQGVECLFEGLELVREICGSWMQERREREQREEDVRVDHVVEEAVVEPVRETVVPRETKREVKEVKVWCSEAIVDRKSVFIGHAAVARSVEDVNVVLNQLLQDKRIAKATHNILAYRITGNGIILADNDDDGESAAGSRLGHLMGLLDVKDVVVIVSRWYGGIQLGADRFKHINSAARDALVVGGFLEVVGDAKKGKKK